MKTTGYTPLLHKSWRGLVYNYGNMIEGIGPGSKLYCLTNFEVMFLQQNVDYMRWITRWENIDITSSELLQLADDLELKLMTCIDIQPWMIQFNYDQTVLIALQNYSDLYDIGGIPELNSNTPTDFFNGDNSDDRQDALCTACNIYIRTYAQNWIQKAQIALGIVAVVGVVASISIVGGIIASVLVGGLALLTQVGLDAMQDDDALDNVVCCMRDGLNGLAVTQANFETALDACGFTVGSNEAIIRDIIASDLDQWDNYLSFLNSLGDTYVLALAGITACVCINPEMLITWDTLTPSFGTLTWFPSGGFTVANAQIPQSNEQGEPVPSLKSAYGNSGSNYGLSNWWRLVLPAELTIVEVSFRFWFKFPVAPMNFVARDIQLYNLGATVQLGEGHDYGSNANQSQWQQFTYTPATPITNVWELWGRIGRTTGLGGTSYANSHGFIDNIRIEYL